MLHWETILSLVKEPNLVVAEGSEQLFVFRAKIFRENLTQMASM